MQGSTRGSRSRESRNVYQPQMPESEPQPPATSQANHQSLPSAAQIQSLGKPSSQGLSEDSGQRPKQRQPPPPPPREAAASATAPKTKDKGIPVPGTPVAATPPAQPSVTVKMDSEEGSGRPLLNEQQPSQPKSAWANPLHVSSSSLTVPDKKQPRYPYLSPMLHGQARFLPSSHQDSQHTQQRRGKGKP